MDVDTGPSGRSERPRGVTRGPGSHESKPMTESDPRPNESIDLSNDRAVRALTEHMSVLPESADLFTVVGEHGSTYTVDVRDGVCECPDSVHRGATCKHQLRALVATGRLAVPAWINRDAVDELLGAHVAATPRFVAADGGEVLAEDTDEADETAAERPDDCVCEGPDDVCVCLPCYMAGFAFDEPNPEPPADEHTEDGTEGIA